MWESERGCVVHVCSHPAVCVCVLYYINGVRCEMLCMLLSDMWLLPFSLRFGLFQSDKNHVYCERCVGILGTLATIHRQRGGVPGVRKCTRILELDERVLGRYRDMTSRCSDRDQISCCRCVWGGEGGEGGEGRVDKKRMLWWGLCCL